MLTTTTRLRFASSTTVVRLSETIATATMAATRRVSALASSPSSSPPITTTITTTMMMLMGPSSAMTPSLWRGAHVVKSAADFRQFTPISHPAAAAATKRSYHHHHHQPQSQHSLHHPSPGGRPTSTPPTTTGSNFHSSSAQSTSSTSKSNSASTTHPRMTAPAPPNPWASNNIKVLELADKKELVLADMWKDQRVLLILLRRFGCSLCHEQASHVLEIKPQLDAAGVKIVLVGTGNRYFAEKFIENVPGNGQRFPAEVYIDPEQTAYKARGLQRVGLLHFLSWTAISEWRKANKNHPNADLQGDGLQTGGIYLVGPGADSAIHFAFNEYDHPVGTLVDNDQILAAVKATQP
ncbi:hypothetical protein CAOG_03149 [Capsaspora owczarzaki ATCC 30864]|uniref:Uncharacterized protein n=1 Tax=Capsaspora owczarzaki (strain ATCC 30864) TaxID=595528 RepID=A0A0D2UAU4_CAPO3|nr:hypothetical protein CAOG_03149 [Capsaspora owczarzaki ATCC 30864]KJE92131.1 hypothetical protein CAOG_003149 [Capsaspora owczarzaki ATCC 30864]|eukprot:XP_004363988.2 hypothetical protein CAOG_03149 [Capsaspora owczarzaki ATCC 30864]